MTDDEHARLKAAATILLRGEGWLDADEPPTDGYPVLLVNVDLQATRMTVDTCIFDVEKGMWIDWRGIPIDPAATKRLPTHFKRWGKS